MAVSRDAKRKKLLSPEETKQMPPRSGQRWVMGPTGDWVGQAGLEEGTPRWCTAWMAAQGKMRRGDRCGLGRA